MSMLPVICDHPGPGLLCRLDGVQIVVLAQGGPRDSLRRVESHQLNIRLVLHEYA